MSQAWNRYLSAIGAAIACGVLGFGVNLPAIASSSLLKAKSLPKSQIRPAIVEKFKLEKLKQNGDKINELNLTETQKQYLLEIRKDTRKKLEAVLTNAQKAQIRQAKQSGQNPRDTTIKSIQLTDAQMQQIRSIQENSRLLIRAILTPEQRARLEQMRPNRKPK